ncbi:hypothetical protein NDU88_002989 [Pleurodeles waltl]|uniref:Uncharacterized protein n=1 Tax=Pleurodeles waltl TaxID=8319 RepID=A0AAV7SF08_PLEWA|nr:hypothetical protein NDU88_002989 [Pleurodeles waltl]
MLGHTVRTRIPIWESSAHHVQQASDHDELAEIDRTKKAKIKKYANMRQRAQPSTVQEGDWVLFRQEQKRKSDSQYHEHPLQVTSRKGTIVTAVSEDKRVTRNITHFRKCNLPPKQATLGVNYNVTEDAPTPVTRMSTPLSSAVGEPTPPTSASRPQCARHKHARLIEEI